MKTPDIPSIKAKSYKGWEELIQLHSDRYLFHLTQENPTMWSLTVTSSKYSEW